MLLTERYHEAITLKLTTALLDISGLHRSVHDASLLFGLVLRNTLHEFTVLAGLSQDALGIVVRPTSAYSIQDLLVFNRDLD